MDVDIDVQDLLDRFAAENSRLLQRAVIAEAQAEALRRRVVELSGDTPTGTDDPEDPTLDMED